MRKTLLTALAAALLAALGAADASAYSHSFTNLLSQPVRFWVNYAACSNDSWIVKPGQVITWRSGLCCISGAKVADPNGGQTLTPGKNEFQGSEAAYYSLSWMEGEFPGAICRNTNWSLRKDGSKITLGGG